MPHFLVVIAWWSPMDSPVRGSPVPGAAGARWPGRSLASAASLALVERARDSSIRIARSESDTAMGASEVVSMSVHSRWWCFRYDCCFGAPRICIGDHGRCIRDGNPVVCLLQVGSYKLRGQRIFRMAPIHHHYELKGWPEPRVIVRFWIISIVLVLIGLATLKIR